MVAVKAATATIPPIIKTIATILPRCEWGYTSPYPTVEAVTIDHQKLSKNELKFCGSIKVINNDAIIKKQR